MTDASVWFVVPCHRRFELTRACLTALRWTCDDLETRGIPADGCVIADDRNLDAALELGFGTVERDNRWLGAKVNDGIQFGAAEGYTHVCYIGSDNWLHPEWVTRQLLANPDAIGAMRDMVAISPARDQAAHLRITYDGGPGVRLTPLRLYKPLHYRPIPEQRGRAIDAATAGALQRTYRPGVVRRLYRYLDLFPDQLLGFYSRDVQITDYERLVDQWAIGHLHPDHWITDRWPESLRQLAATILDRKALA